MNGDTATKTKWRGWSLVKWVVGVVTIFAILGAFFWLFFYSVYFANLSFIIPLRYWYEDVYWKAESLVLKPTRVYPLFDPVYTISVDKADVAGAYTYSLWGVVSRVDAGNKTIYILGSDGREYIFVSNNYSFNFTGPANKDFSQMGIAAFKGAKVLAKWQDARSLYAIKKAYDQNKTAPINQNTVGENLTFKIFSN